MKAVMIEYVNDDGAWEWYRVRANVTPREALKDYLEEHDLEDEKIEDERGEVFVEDTVRAYEITIE